MPHRLACGEDLAAQWRTAPLVADKDGGALAAQWLAAPLRAIPGAAEEGGEDLAAQWRAAPLQAQDGTTKGAGALAAQWLAAPLEAKGSAAEMQAAPLHTSEEEVAMRSSSTVEAAEVRDGVAAPEEVEIDEVIESLPKGVIWHAESRLFHVRGPKVNGKRLKGKTFSADKLGLARARQLAVQSSRAQHGRFIAIRTRNSPQSRTNALWSDKHVPKTLLDANCKDPAWRQLSLWLRDWVPQPQGQTAAPRPSQAAFAALVTGGLGCGKSVGARLVASRWKTHRHILQFDARDSEGRSLIESLAKKQSTVDGLANAVIILEIDDGISETLKYKLSKAVRLSPSPIILVGDEGSVTERDFLFRLCLRLQLKRPTSAFVMDRLARVAKREGHGAVPEAWRLVAQSCGGDLRRALNAAQLLGAAPGAPALLHVTPTPLAACERLMAREPLEASGAEGAGLGVSECLELLSIDEEALPETIRENYLAACAPEVDEALRSASSAADALIQEDLMDTAAEEGGHCRHAAASGVLLAAVRHVSRTARGSFKAQTPRPEPPYLQRAPCVERLRADHRLPRLYISNYLLLWQGRRQSTRQSGVSKDFRAAFNEHVAWMRRQSSRQPPSAVDASAEVPPALGHAGLADDSGNGVILGEPVAAGMAEI